MGGVPGVRKAVGTSDGVWVAVSGSEHFSGPHHGSPERDSILMGQDVSPHGTTAARAQEQREKDHEELISNRLFIITNLPGTADMGCRAGPWLPCRAMGRGALPPRRRWHCCPTRNDDLQHPRGATRQVPPLSRQAAIPALLEPPSSAQPGEPSAAAPRQRGPSRAPAARTWP